MQESKFSDSAITFLLSKSSKLKSNYQTSILEALASPSFFFFLVETLSMVS